MNGGCRPASQHQACLEQVALNQFGDILRVGTLAINVDHIKWDCHGLSKEEQLKNFKRAFLETLEATDGLLCRKTSEYINLLPEEKEVLWFWVMKATSINYALFEVMMTLHSVLETDDPCQVVTVETYNPQSGQHRMKYGLTTYHDRVEVRMMWQETADNIFLVNPVRATRVQRGFLSEVLTSFPLPLEPVFWPTYYVTARLRGKLQKNAKRNILLRMMSKCCLKGQCDLFHPLHVTQNLSHVEHLPHHPVSPGSITSTSNSVRDSGVEPRIRTLNVRKKKSVLELPYHSPLHRQAVNGTPEDSEISEGGRPSLVVPAEGFAAPLPASSSVQQRRQNQWHITWKPLFRRESTARRRETTLQDIHETMVSNPAPRASNDGSPRRQRNSRHTSLLVPPVAKTMTPMQRLHKYATSPSLFLRRKSKVPVNRSDTTPTEINPLPPIMSNVTAGFFPSGQSWPSAGGPSCMRTSKLRGKIHTTRKLTAVAYYDAMASAGDPIGMLVLGQMCYHDVLSDVSIPNRLQKAKWYFERAKELGNMEAIQWLQKVERRIERDAFGTSLSATSPSEQTTLSAASSREFAVEDERIELDSIVPWLKTYSSSIIVPHFSTARTHVHHPTDSVRHDGTPQQDAL